MKKRLLTIIYVILCIWLILALYLAIKDWELLFSYLLMPIVGLLIMAFVVEKLSRE